MFSNLLSLKGKVAVITGGGSGIGESICKLFAEAGAQVCILELNESNGQRVAAEIHQQGGAATFIQTDVTDQEKMIRQCQEVVDRFGSLDILVNNAGIAHVGSLETTSETDFIRIFDVNVRGVYNGMYAAMPHMKKQRRGVILNMGSVAANLGLPDRFAYSMSKGAVQNMTYTVARDYLEYNIRCNSIAPGRVHTPFVDGFIARNYPGKEQEMFDKLSKTQPIGRMGKPSEIAFLALYLCSEASGFITGTNYPIDGGFVTLNT